jgi:hypothetical protein
MAMDKKGRVSLAISTKSGPRAVGGCGRARARRGQTTRTRKRASSGNSIEVGSLPARVSHHVQILAERPPQITAAFFVDAISMHPLFVERRKDLEDLVVIVENQLKCDWRSHLNESRDPLFRSMHEVGKKKEL